MVGIIGIGLQTVQCIIKNGKMAVKIPVRDKCAVENMSLTNLKTATQFLSPAFLSSLRIVRLEIGLFLLLESATS